MFYLISRSLLFVLARPLGHADSLILSSQEAQQEYERHAFIDGLTSLYEPSLAREHAGLADHPF